MSKRNLFLISSATASFLTPFIVMAINIALPAIAETFNINITVANWVTNSFLIPMASTILLMGAIADWIGKELVFIGGAAIFTISSFLTPYAGNFTMLIILRCIQGLGAAMISGTAVAILVDIFPEKAGFVIGLNTASVYVGASLGPALGGFLIDYIGWPSLFILTGTVALISITLALLSLDFIGKGIGRRPHFHTLLLFAISTILVVFGSTYIGSFYGLVGLSLGLMIFISILYVEYKKSLNLVKEFFERSILLAYVTALLSYIATYALSISFSNFLQIEEGFRARETGLILLAQPLSQMLLSPIAGYLSDKFNPGLLTVIGMILVALGIGSSTIMYRWLALLIASLILIGIGFALFASPNITQIMRGAPKEALASASSFLGLMRFLGQSLSTSILTASMLALKQLTISIEAALIVYMFIAACGIATAALSTHSR